MVSDDAVLISQAMLLLKQESSFWKDYVFPIASALFTSILGGWIAYFTLVYQERIRVVKERVDAANKCTFAVFDMFQTLITIKDLYRSKITSDYMQRAHAMTHVLLLSEKITVDLNALSFLIPDRDDVVEPASSILNKMKNIILSILSFLKLIDDVKSVGGVNKWKDVSLIYALVKNYNNCLFFLNKRNIVFDKYVDSFYSKKGYTHFRGLSASELIGVVGRHNLVDLVEITEQLIVLIDDLIVESNDFLGNFPDVIKSSIEPRLLAKSGVFVNKISENENSVDFLNYCPDVDKVTLSKLLGISPDEVATRYSTGYRD